ncbi:MAG: TIGR00180 family glycosyltransferase [Burkholderiales bacterium]|nr:TIGR00180 family glycosyltransferase [Burkholderiales bacterium]
MRIDDADCFALLVPTYQGTPFVRRLLEFLDAENYPGHVVLTDNSRGEDRAFVESCPARYPGLWLDVQCYDFDIGFLDKLARTLERLEARNVMLCGQDDFVVPQTVEKLLALIESDPGLSCVRGRVARFLLRPVAQAGSKPAVRVHLNNYPMLPYEDADPLARVLAHLQAYTSTLYALHRRDRLLECFRFTDAATRNVIFWQYLSSCVTVAQGRVACLDELFLARQIHKRSWSATATDDEHWPLLVTSPNYSTYYQGFRSALIDFLRGRAGVADDATLGARIDRGFVELFRRVFCGTSQTDAANKAFFARLQTAGTVEEKLMSRVTQFTLRYGDTY